MSELRDEYVAALGPDLLRFCTALAPAAAPSLAAQGLAALSERKVRRGEQVAHRAVLRQVVRRYLKGGYPAPTGVTPERWAAAVLTSVEEVPAHELPWFIGSPVDVSHVADVTVPIQEGGRVPDDLARRGAAEVTLKRRARRQRSILLAFLIALAGVLGVSGYTLATHVGRPGVADGEGLIKWKPRGDLLLDEGLRHRAERVWRESVSGRLEHVQTLWAGHVGDGRLVVLQGYDETSTPQVAAIGEQSSGLVLLQADAMPNAPDLLVIPYSGLTELTLNGSVAGARLVRVLVDPDTNMQRRALQVKALADQDRLGPWETLRFHDGLSEPWLDLSTDFALTALRDRGMTYLLTDSDSLLTRTPQLGASAPRLRAGSDEPPTEDQMADDVLAIEQYAFVPDVEATLLWVGFGSSVTNSVRIYNLVPRPGCPDACDRGLWVVEGAAGVANPVRGGIVDGSLVVHISDYVELFGAPGAASCTLSGDDVERLTPTHLEGDEGGVARSFSCKDSKGRTVSSGSVTKA